MKVKELIEKLQAMDQGLTVYNSTQLVLQKIFLLSTENKVYLPNE